MLFGDRISSSFGSSVSLLLCGGWGGRGVFSSSSFGGLAGEGGGVLAFEVVSDSAARVRHAYPIRSIVKSASLNSSSRPARRLDFVAYSIFSGYFGSPNKWYNIRKSFPN